ncbi:RrF2 family transcriptional regulator [Lentiprolixibacter aurantiacus]|uniref:Rrf2 family transcriptional regulator n=1 Tax=Lentiprolixibacter aurantiacus TaxID=2993939 RepID=A0AAE3MJV5_9FLAO|nr:Rrf2 family transcriptional regulator [Lentiprolixibacter aurantiacus]MCX2718774.1 Rrf2 family transcriptional regulator [Lentiprolixibacter aurantiacus]
MISNSAKYAIKAVIYLGLHSSKSNKILTREMFEEIRVSESYLAKILQQLSRSGIISSTKGRNGGFYLSAENTEHSLMDIVRVIDGDKSIASCILGINNCDMDHPCPLHDLVGKGRTEFNSTLENTNLKDIIFKLQGKDVYYPL